VWSLQTFDQSRAFIKACEWSYCAHKRRGSCKTIANFAAQCRSHDINVPSSWRRHEYCREWRWKIQVKLMLTHTFYRVQLHKWVCARRMRTRDTCAMLHQLSGAHQSQHLRRGLLLPTRTRRTQKDLHRGGEMHLHTEWTRVSTWAAGSAALLYLVG
jgi:hypothetical protein